jgi:hypothetical protein
VECDWLTTPADTWKDNDSYRNVQKFVRLVKVTNGVAEKGVKLMSDFTAQITTDPEQRGCLLQVVEYQRSWNKFDSSRKATLNKDNTCISDILYDSFLHNICVSV